MSTDLGLDGFLETPRMSDEARKLQTATGRVGTVNLQLDGIQFNDRYMVTVGGVAVSAALPSRMLAEQFISQLPPSQQTSAQIVSATPDGKQMLLG